MLYSISIVSHNQINLCIKAINSISQFIRDFEIILTINVDESLSGLNTEIDNLIIIKNEHPLGFGQNHNNAFEKSSGELFLVVNPDIEIINWSDFSFGQNILYAPKVLDADGIVADNHRNYPTPMNLIKRKIFQKRELNRDWIAGMFLIIPRNLFVMLNGFDDSFFMYLEDTDLSIRTKAIGGKLEVIECCIVVHDAQRKSGKDITHLYYHIRSLLKFYIKYPYLIFNI